MNAKLSGLTLTLALAMGAAGPALAGGDVIYQGYKDPAAAIPVPAPIPIEEYAPEYYVRADLGFSWMSSGTIDETGTGLNLHDAGDVEAIEWGSLGAGRYVTPSIRVEVAVDLSTNADLNIGGSQTITQHHGGATYTIRREDEVKYEQDLGMLTAYYDFRNGSRFTPYIGAGIGLSYRHLTRTASETTTCAAGSSCDSNRLGVEASATNTDARWDFAAAATAGIAYELTDDIFWDTSYRYLWTGGDMRVNSASAFAGNSSIDVESISQHQIRTGVRLNLN